MGDTRNNLCQFCETTDFNKVFYVPDEFIFTEIGSVDLLSTQDLSYRQSAGYEYPFTFEFKGIVIKGYTKEKKPAITPAGFFEKWYSFYTELNIELGKKKDYEQ